MHSVHSVVLVLAVQLLGTVLVSGELTSSQKQILLDLNNQYRASQARAAVRILVSTMCAIWQLQVLNY